MSSQLYTEQNRTYLNQSSNVTLTQPFDTPTAFIKKPLLLKSPFSKQQHLENSPRNSSDRSQLAQNKGFCDEFSSPPRHNLLSQRTISFKQATPPRKSLNSKESNSLQQNISSTQNDCGNIFASPSQKSPSTSYQHAFANLNICNTAGSTNKYTQQLSANNQINNQSSSTDFLKTITQSPMFLKAFHSDWKFSPACSPFKGKNLDLQGMLGRSDNDLPSTIMTRGSGYHHSLLSPAPSSETSNLAQGGAHHHHQQITHTSSFKDQRKEASARRLFQSPTHYRPQLKSVTKGGTKIYQNKLEDIIEEESKGTQGMMTETAQHHNETHQHSFHKSRTESQSDMHLILNDSNSFRNNKNILHGMDDDDELLFMTPTLEGGAATNNQNLSQIMINTSDQKLKNSNHHYHYQQQQQHANGYQQFSHQGYADPYFQGKAYSSQKEFQPMDQPAPSSHYMKQQHRIKKTIIQQLGLQNSNFNNSAVNIKFEHIPQQIKIDNCYVELQSGYFRLAQTGSEAEGQYPMGQYYIPVSEKDQIRLRAGQHFVGPNGEIIQINPKHHGKVLGSHGKKTFNSSTKKQQQQSNSALKKRLFNQYMHSSSGKKVLIQQSQTNMMTQSTTSQHQSLSKSSQKQQMKRKIQEQQVMRMYEQQMEDPKYQTPKVASFNNGILSPPTSNQTDIQMIENSVSKMTPNYHMQQSDNKSSTKNASGRTTCNCKKSKCLKLYCDCFALGMGCSPDCNCSDCSNHEDNDERKLAMDAILDRNPLAFKPKIQQEKGYHSKGCHCKKSNCLKKYCECYQSGVACTELCACEGCKNCEDRLISGGVGHLTGNSASKDFNDELDASPMHMDDEKGAKQMIMATPPPNMKSLNSNTKEDVEKLLYSDEKIQSPPRSSNHKHGAKNNNGNQQQQTSNDKKKAKDQQSALKLTPEKKGRAHHHKHNDQDHEMVEVHEERTANKRQKINHHTHEKHQESTPEVKQQQVNSCVTTRSKRKQQQEANKK